ncbi:MAG: hypothetical protein WCK85_12715, partial [Chlorobium sp.]
ADFFITKSPTINSWAFVFYSTFSSSLLSPLAPQSLPTFPFSFALLSLLSLKSLPLYPIPLLPNNVPCVPPVPLSSSMAFYYIEGLTSRF